MKMGEMTLPQIGSYLRDHEWPIVIVPISPVEEHGPHLPLGTDFLLTQFVAWVVAEKCDAVVFPTIPLMCCGISNQSAGTYPIEGDTLKSLTRDLIRSLVAKGFLRIFFMTTHFGYSTERMQEAVTESQLEMANDALVVQIIQFNKAVAPKLRPGLIQTQGDTHAGEIETSAMLAILPEMVGELPPADYHVVIDGKPAVLSASGINGDPQKATPKKGEEIIQAAIEASLEIIQSTIPAKV